MLDLYNHNHNIYQVCEMSVIAAFKVMGLKLSSQNQFSVGPLFAFDVCLTAVPHLTHESVDRCLWNVPPHTD